MLFLPFLPFLLFPLLPATGSPAAPQDDPPPEVSQEAVAVEARKQAYEALLGEYRSAVESHSFAVRKMRGEGVPREEWPPRPVHEFFPRFVELAEQGNADAMLWVVDQADLPVPSDEERIRLRKRYFTALAEHHAAEDCMLSAIERLYVQRAYLGRDFALGTMRAIAANCGVAETEAAAIYGEAMIFHDQGQVEDPGEKAKIDDLLHVLVDGYPKTEAARRAADHLYFPLYEETRSAQGEWMGKARELHAEGVGPEGWPTYPLEAFLGPFQALASTGHVLSARWVDEHYPGYAAANEKGVVEALRYVLDWIAREHQPAHEAWTALEFEILDLLIEVGSDRPWMDELVTMLEGQVARFTPERYGPVLRKLMDRTRDERVRFHAMLVLAMSLERGSTSEELHEALAAYQRVIDGAPFDSQREQAEAARRAFAATMPGAPVPTFAAQDELGLEIRANGYRGKVLLIYFWSFNEPESVAGVPWVNRLYRTHRDRPFRVLGMNVDTATQRHYAKKVGELGVAWRNALLQTMRSPVVETFHVSHLPMAFVIDAAGVIRGRALDHEAAEALIERLLAE